MGRWEGEREGGGGRGREGRVGEGRWGGGPFHAITTAAL